MKVTQNSAAAQRSPALMASWFHLAALLSALAFATGARADAESRGPDAIADMHAAFIEQWTNMLARDKNNEETGRRAGCAPPPRQ